MSFFLASQVTVSERNPLEQNPVDYLLEYEDVSFSPRSDDTGISLKGWFIPAEVTTDTTIIIVHGLNSNRAAGFMLPISQKLHQNGFNTLLIDLRGHGESGGDSGTGIAGIFFAEAGSPESLPVSSHASQQAVQ